MNIVIEGCDGSGKTAIANLLAKQLGLNYWHESAPRTYQEYCQMLEFGGTVFDRFCFGQFVYNQPDERKMTENELQMLIHEIFPKTNTLLIYVNCPTDVIIDRLIARGEGSTEVKYDMEKWVKNIRGTYKSILNTAKANYIELNGTTTLQGGTQ